MKNPKTPPVRSADKSPEVGMKKTPTQQDPFDFDSDPDFDQSLRLLTAAQARSKVLGRIQTQHSKHAEGKHKRNEIDNQDEVNNNRNDSDMGIQKVTDSGSETEDESAEVLDAGNSRDDTKPASKAQNNEDSRPIEHLVDNDKEIDEESDSDNSQSLLSGDRVHSAVNIEGSRKRLFDANEEGDKEPDEPIKKKKKKTSGKSEPLYPHKKVVKENEKENQTIQAKAPKQRKKKDPPENQPRIDQFLTPKKGAIEEDDNEQVSENIDYKPEGKTDLPGCSSWVMDGRVITLHPPGTDPKDIAESDDAQETSTIDLTDSGPLEEPFEEMQDNTEIEEAEEDKVNIAESGPAQQPETLVNDSYGEIDGSLQDIFSESASNIDDVSISQVQDLEKMMNSPEPIISESTALHENDGAVAQKHDQRLVSGESQSHSMDMQAEVEIGCRNEAEAIPSTSMEGSAKDMATRQDQHTGILINP